MRKVIAALVVLVVMVLTAAPASATCTTGYIGYDKDTRKVRIEMPECHPYE